jgi:hypothetical protein
MRIALMVLAVFGAVCLAMGQAVARWQRTYGVSGYEALFAALQHDGAGTLYLLASLRQLGGEDAVSLVRCTLRGAPLDARPYGISNGAQEEGVGLQALPNGECVVVCALSEPIWASGTVRPEQTTVVYYPAVGAPTLEQRVSGLPVALAWGDSRLFIATQTPRGQTRYVAVDPATRTLQETSIASGYAVAVDIAWSASQGVVLGGWGSTSSGRTGFHWRNNAFSYLDAPFSYISQVQPLPNGNIVYLWGSGNQNEAWMYGPDGLQAERLTLQSAISESGEAFVYVLTQQESGYSLAFTLVRIAADTLTRQWELPLTDFHPWLWAVDSAGSVYLLGSNPNGREFRKIRSDGSLAWRLSANDVALPLRFAQSLLPLPNGSLIVAGTLPLESGGTEVVVALIGHRGDTNGDGCVDIADLTSVIFAFGTDEFAADLNADGVVDDADLLEVLFAFGAGC